MAETKTATLTLSLEDVQILNNVITNSTPTVPFSVVSGFIAKINSQLTGQFDEPVAEDEVVGDEPKAAPKKVSKLKPVK